MTTVRYIITYGSKRNPHSKECSFTDEKLALQYFQEKQENYEVRAYKETTTIVRERIDL